ncbi:brain-specific angiogenesis inhibitor 1-associated protein 2-like protein 2 isoform X2 [Betta splendens]|uniref:Brain-specific angiogenesis inhibitor 1-associated protein 2-like protein 2 isoform X2 n=1 Tax=Betta splendens TaxID=158456 RepID=A0A6P7N4Z9_BETSP|nr:brain-specific angiogenesis inhibitor 1-associated protein 2-like protein 2 isoform X2 [Betta splendens]
MSGMNGDQLHRATLGVYASLMDEFNPSLQKLVSLGNSYVQAYKALAATSEAYFRALSKIGEKAFHTVSSQPIGDVLIQISETQRRLTLELEGVFRRFNAEVLQEMDNNVRLDQDYISGSLRFYETEVYRQRAAQEAALRPGAAQDGGLAGFLRRSHQEALQEEERRYRFLAEKHCGLLQSIAQLMNKTGGSLQQRADAWTAEVNATRHVETRPGFSSASSSVGPMEAGVARSRAEPGLGSVPSRAPSPQGSLSRSAGGARSMRALVAHQPAGSSPTLLPFGRGETIAVKVQQPRNGWLYGRADGSARQGWFPASFVEPVEDPPESMSSSSSLRSRASISDLIKQPQSRASGPPPPPPPPPSASSGPLPETTAASFRPDDKPEPPSENRRSQPHRSHPELFPRGTNPFATVKLKPTTTDDRSAPRLYRR